MEASSPVASPSCPELLSPQAQTEPSTASAREKSSPAAMAEMTGRPPTRAGVELSPPVPVPNWPLSLSPQAQTEPPAASAREWSAPAARALASRILGTCTAMGSCGVAAKLPIWPSSLSPQPHTDPSSSTAKEWSWPAATDMTSVRSATRAPSMLFVVVPSPSWPEVLVPQAKTVPSVMTTSEC